MSSPPPPRKPAGEALLADILAGCAPAPGAQAAPITMTFNFAAGASLVLVVGDAAQVQPPSPTPIGNRHAG